MLIPFTEATSPRYIYINPKSNYVHVLMPIMTGTEIGMDNTCKSVFSLQEFFGKSQDIHQKAILDELSTYKKTLEFDISLISEDTKIKAKKQERLEQINHYDELSTYKKTLEFDISFISEDIKIKAKKQERLEQINHYIEAIKAVLKSDELDGLSKAFPEYPTALQELMGSKESNLHSMVLRPQLKDEYLRSVNPVFSVNRKGKSVFYNIVSDAFKEIKPQPNAKSRFIASVVQSLKEKNNFKEIQRVLTEQTIKQLGIKDIDSFNIHKETELTKDYIDNIMLFDEDNLATDQDYVDALLGICTPKLFDEHIESPFYTIKNAEELSVVTQFFLGSVNIYCRAHSISSANFGEALDKSKELSQMVANIVMSMQDGTKVEDALLNFVNEQTESFELKKQLSPTDKAIIKNKFTEQFIAVKESPHFDEFTLLDDTKPGPFITHQGGICLDFAELAQKVCPKVQPDYFKEVRSDFEELKGVVTHNNPSVHAAFEMSIEELVVLIKDEEQLDTLLKKLSKDQQQEILDSPSIKKLQVPKFLHHVARGQQDEAKKLLQANPQLLLQTGEFTDYSGRTYHCTAYEKAYWDKDTHMCRMLEQNMDEDTKAELLKRCEAIEKDGLKYTQNGRDYCTSHFDFTPLKTALKDYTDGYNNWCDKDNWVAIKSAWLKVGLAQRDVPAHVINEYCRPDRPFDPTPEFDEDELPRVVTFYNLETEWDEAVFPLAITESSGLGVNFGLYRALEDWCGSWDGVVSEWWSCGGCDLLAVSRLDEVRTEDLKQSLENLKPRYSKQKNDCLIS